MTAYRDGSHTVYQCHYHFVCIPKYRKPVLLGEVGLRLRELIREVCKASNKTPNLTKLISRSQNEGVHDELQAP